PPLEKCSPAARRTITRTAACASRASNAQRSWSRCGMLTTLSGGRSRMMSARPRGSSISTRKPSRSCRSPWDGCASVIASPWGSSSYLQPPLPVWSSMLLACAALGCHRQNGRDDWRVSGAAAQMSREHLAYLKLSWLRHAFEKVRRRQQDSGGTEPALERVVAAKRQLQVGKLTLAIRQPFHGLNVLAFDRHRKRQARALRQAIDAHRARS